MITPEMPSIKKLKSRIYYLKKEHHAPVYNEEEKEKITFSRTELATNIKLRTNPLVMEAIMRAREIEKCKIRRLIVDIGASKNILYYNCFKEMGLNDHQLKPSSMVQEGFTAHKIIVKGTIKLMVTMGSTKK